MIERGKNEALQTDRSLKENYRQGETVNDNDWRVNEQVHMKAGQ